MSASGCGGMADAQDSKSCGGDLVWVQVPPSAYKKDIPDKCLGYFFCSGKSVFIAIKAEMWYHFFIRMYSEGGYL